MAQNPNLGAFIPSTEILNINSDPTSPEFRDGLVRLYQVINNIAMLLNVKDTGQYSPLEYVCGRQYLFGQNPLQVFRKVISFGSLPNTGTATVAHGIKVDTNTVFTNIYGTTTDTTAKVGLPLPYASSTAANNIELNVGATNITIITGSDRTSFTTTYIVIEYIKYS